MALKDIWIVRERLDWHNYDPEDATYGFATRELAEICLNKKIEHMKKYFCEREYELLDDMTKIKSDYVRMVTSDDDWYQCWIESILFFDLCNE